MLATPERHEAAPYYFTYIDRVPPGDIRTILATQLDETLPYFRGISEEHSLHSYAPDKWTIRQVLSHINDTERLFQCRAFWFARGFDSPLPSFDQNICAAAAKANDFSWASHIDEFRTVRSATLSFFQNLPAEAWLRSGVASDNPFTVRALAYMAAGHLVHHVAILQERYL